MDRKESSACHHEVGQAEQREQLRRVLRQSPVAGLAMTKQVLNDMERMLDLRPDARLGLFVLLEQSAQSIRTQHLALAGAHGHVPVGLRVLVLFTLLDALVARVTERIGLITVEQRMGLGHVRDIGRSAHERMDQSRFEINADVAFMPKCHSLPFFA